MAQESVDQEHDEALEVNKLVDIAYKMRELSEKYLDPVGILELFKQPNAKNDEEWKSLIRCIVILCQTIGHVPPYIMTLIEREAAVDCAEYMLQNGLFE